jgi:acyl carrier protein
MRLTPMTPDTLQTHPQPLSEDRIRAVVMTAMQAANLSRDPDSQLTVAPDAPVFGPDSPLDSLGLVALLLDIEEDLVAIGCHIVLSDERAMSQKRSPFRSVSSIAEYISSVIQD